MAIAGWEQEAWSPINNASTVATWGFRKVAASSTETADVTMDTGRRVEMIIASIMEPDPTTPVRESSGQIDSTSTSANPVTPSLTAEAGDFALAMFTARSSTGSSNTYTPGAGLAVRESGFWDTGATMRWMVVGDSSGPVTAGSKSYSLGVSPTPNHTNTALWIIQSAPTGPQEVNPAGISSEEAFGTPGFTAKVTLSPSGIASAEAFGTAALQPGSVTVSPTGIASGETFGDLAVQQGEAFPQEILVEGIPSSEGFGDVLVSPIQLVTAVGIASEEAFGEPALEVGVWFFAPPTVEEGPAGGGRLFYRYKLTRGVTVVQREDGSFYQTRFPDNETELLVARKVYLGGHVYRLSAEEVTLLTEAGYGDYLYSSFPD